MNNIENRNFQFLWSCLIGLEDELAEKRWRNVSVCAQDVGPVLIPKNFSDAKVRWAFVKRRGEVTFAFLGERYLTKSIKGK